VSFLVCIGQYWSEAFYYSAYLMADANCLLCFYCCNPAIAPSVFSNVYCCNPAIAPSVFSNVYCCNPAIAPSVFSNVYCCNPAIAPSVFSNLYCILSIETFQSDYKKIKQEDT
jgi:hypothetical protein